MSADDQNGKANDECSAASPPLAKGVDNNSAQADLNAEKNSLYLSSQQHQDSTNQSLIKKTKNTKSTLDQQQQASQQKQTSYVTTHGKQAEPSIIHPNFDRNSQPLDPARSLCDIPMPAPRQMNPMLQLYGISIEHPTLQNDDLSEKGRGSDEKMASGNKLYSQWELIDSPALSSYLELLKAGGLIRLPHSFYRHPNPDHAKPLLKPLYPLSAQAAALDMADIHAVIEQYPQLTRYGLQQVNHSDKQTAQSADKSIAKYSAAQNKLLNKRSHNFHAKLSKSIDSIQLALAMPEMLNDGFAPNWEVILYPERFDNGVDSLATDLLACRLAVHVLQQCETRQSINRKLCAQQICQYMRSYLLSQCRLSGRDADEYRYIRLYAGHVIVAAIYLGWEMQISEDNCAYFAVSSRSALFTRYPNLFEYYIDGWQ